MIGRVRRRLRGRPPATPSPEEQQLSQLTPEDREIVEHSLPFTMTGIARVQALVDAVRYCVNRPVPGAFVECGVWKGGSVLAMIRTLQQHGISDRDVYLFDTFEGMTEPGDADASRFGDHALETWREAEARGTKPWDYFFDQEQFNLDSVRERVLATGYPEDRVHFVVGRVEDTLPGEAPDRIALLRLDTDWYESTKTEMEHLYPRVADLGVLIVDDYGHWEGSRLAVDEYFENEGRVLLSRIDYSGRMAIKPPAGSRP